MVMSAGTYSSLYGAVHVRQELGAYPNTGWIVLDQQDVRLLRPQRSPVLFRRWCYLLALSHDCRVAQRTGVRDVVDMIRVERIDARRLPDRVHHVSHIAEGILHEAHWAGGRVREHDRRRGRVGRGSGLVVGYR